MPLNLFKSNDQTLMLLQKQWMSLLNPIVSDIWINGFLIPNIQLKTGSNTFPHYLARQMNGWTIVDINAQASIYRSAPLNIETLTLTSDHDVTISLWVF